MAKNPKFVLKTRKDALGVKRHYWNLQARNGKVVLTSEMYVSKQGAKDGIQVVKKQALDPSNFQLNMAKNDQAYFVLKGNNGEVVGVSETYTQRNGAEGGINSIIHLCTVHDPAIEVINE